LIEKPADFMVGRLDNGWRLSLISSAARSKAAFAHPERYSCFFDQLNTHSDCCVNAIFAVSDIAYTTGTQQDSMFLKE
jgi:hypothetical protein